MKIKPLAIDIAAGADCDNFSNLRLFLGDKVLTSKYSGTEVKVDGEECTIVRQSDILAIVE